MATIGFFGPITFRTSDRRILTFRNYSRESFANFAEHRLILRKPQLEFMGTELDIVTFNIDLNASNGVNPMKEYENLHEILKKGEAHTLVIGNKPQGEGKWVIESMSKALNVVLDRGQVYSLTLELSLKEDVEEEEGLVLWKPAPAPPPPMASPVQETQSETKTGTVTASVLNVRPGPGMSHAPIGTLTNGTQITIVGSSGNWLEIEYGGGTAYVYNQYIRVD